MDMTKDELQELVDRLTADNDALAAENARLKEELAKAPGAPPEALTAPLQEYPRWVRKRTTVDPAQPPVVTEEQLVDTKEQHEALGEGWE